LDIPEVSKIDQVVENIGEIKKANRYLECALQTLEKERAI
jgi:cob(I)alamin adenosyltransferase